MIFSREVIKNGYLLKLEIRVNLLPPITKQDSLELGHGSYMIQNVGANAALLDDRWTILSGGNLSLGAAEDTNDVVHTFKVDFDPAITNPEAPYQSNRLEVMELITKICSCTPCQNILK